MVNKKNVIIIGGGASALMLACFLDTNKYAVSIYEKNAALGRKFLVAGDGGLNLTHSEDKQQFVKRYTPSSFIEPFIQHFSNDNFRDWLKSIGIETFVGTSKRVFPLKGIKPIEVLKAIEKKLKENNVEVIYNHEWKGLQDDQLIFQTSNNQTSSVTADIVVFALGGSSWKVTGSDGSWTNLFKEKGININPFYPSNCAYKVNWPEGLVNQIEGKAIKNAVFTCNHINRKGEAVLTKFGIEGSGVYPLSPDIRKQLLRHPELVSGSQEMLNCNSVTTKQLQHKNTATIFVDFKPEFSVEEIKQRFESKGQLSVKDFLEKKLNLSSLQTTLIKAYTNKEDYHSIDVLIQHIKSFKIKITDFAPIDDAISTIGGVDLNEVNTNLELNKLPNHYCIGEMLDWDAPTGGYLLQACFSMGKFLADRLNAK